MASTYAQQKRIRQAILPVVGFCLVSYFIYHTLQGDRGWFAMLRMKHEVAAAQQTLGHLRDERKELEHRTQLLHDNSLDPDLLEEKSRELLNYSRPNEIVIMTPPEGDKPATGK
jgi:cell division protein FtsB